MDRAEKRMRMIEERAAKFAKALETENVDWSSVEKIEGNVSTEEVARRHLAFCDADLAAKKSAAAADHAKAKFGKSE